MATPTKVDEITTDQQSLQTYPTYVPDVEETNAIREVLDTLTKGRIVLSRGYEYFNGRSLIETIDDWTKRWNGYIPPENPLIDQTQSQIFVGFTRNAIISYLAKVAMNPVDAVIEAVNKKTGFPDKQFAEFLKDLNSYSLKLENSDAKFLQSAIECTVKGTVVVYEGYAKNDQKVKIPDKVDFKTGKYSYKEETRTIYDNCFQEVVPLEDFYILNAFQADVQKQPKILWKKRTSYFEGAMEYSHYGNWKYVIPGMFATGGEPTTFYRETVLTNLGTDQVEIHKYYCRKENRHIIMVNGVILYDGPIPFKDGKYPFAKTVNEPFGVDFFWGNGHPGKYMGEQDLVNTFINLMADKSINSLIPTGLSSDLDDLVEDDVIQVGKIRKVGNVANWQWWQAPEVGGGEFNMFQSVLQLARESANLDLAPSHGKTTAREFMLRNQQVQSKYSFSTTYLENLERDRTELRVSHLLQFYSIPKMTKITGKSGEEINQLVYRDIQLTNTKLSDGKTGSKVIKLVDKSYLNPDKRAGLADQLSLTEAQGQVNGVETEALAVVVDTFTDYNYEIVILPNSSYEKNKTMDQATRMEFSNWRIPLAAGGVDPKTGQPIQPVAPADVPAIVKWVEESFDAPTDEFEQQAQQPQQPQMPGQPGAPGQPGTQPAPGQSQMAGGKPQVLNQMQPSNMRGSALNNRPA